jgi:DNA polymerase III epsilon subunit-like protein
MIAIDIEASGVNPEKHSILALGALDFDNPKNEFYKECRLWDGAHIEDDAMLVNGMTEKELYDPNKASEAELVTKFIEWTKDVRGWNLLSQNPAFDLSFIRAASHRAHLDFPFPVRTMDVHTLAYMHMVTRGAQPPFNIEKHGSALNLDHVLSYCGIPEEPKPHNALMGAKCHAEAASRLLYNKILLQEFELYSIPWVAAS